MHLKFKFPTGSIDFLLHILRMSQRFIIKSVSQAAQPFFWYKWTKNFIGWSQNFLLDLTHFLPTGLGGLGTFSGPGPLATDIRTKYNNSDIDFGSFMSTGKSSDDLRMLREIMAVFE